MSDLWKMAAHWNGAPTHPLPLSENDYGIVERAMGEQWGMDRGRNGKTNLE
jgi:hypothetical protein